MKKSLIFLVFLNLSFLSTTAELPVKAQDNNNSWIDFAFCNCNPYYETIYNNQQNNNGYSFDDSIEPETYTLEVNITNLTNTSIEIYRKIDFTQSNKYVFEQGSDYIYSTGSYNFILKANTLTLNLISNSTTLQFDSVQGFYRLFRNGTTMIFDWKYFSLLNCSPNFKLIFKDDNNVHNITTHISIDSMTDGSLNIYYSRKGLLDGVSKVTEFTTNGSFAYNDIGSSISVSYYGENNSLVNGSYLIEDLGIVSKNISGFNSLDFLVLIVNIVLIRKIRMKKKLH